MIEFRAEHFSLDFENEKKWYPALWKVNYSSVDDGPSAKGYAPWRSSVFGW